MISRSIFKVNLVGGYYDAGDNVKFGLPHGIYSDTDVWIILEYGQQMASSGELGNSKDAVKWGTEYLIKAHPEPNIFLWRGCARNAEVGVMVKFRYRFVQDFHFFVTGDDDENELILSIVLQGFFDAVNFLLRSRF